MEFNWMSWVLLVSIKHWLIYQKNPKCCLQKYLWSRIFGNFLMIDSNAFTTDFISLVFCVKSNKHIKNSLMDAFFTTLHFYTTPLAADNSRDATKMMQSTETTIFVDISQKRLLRLCQKENDKMSCFLLLLLFSNILKFKKMRQNMQNLLWDLVWIVILTFIGLLLACSLFWLFL